MLLLSVENYLHQLWTSLVRWETKQITERFMQQWNFLSWKAWWPTAGLKAWQTQITLALTWAACTWEKKKTSLRKKALKVEGLGCKKGMLASLWQACRQAATGQGTNNKTNNKLLDNWDWTVFWNPYKYELWAIQIEIAAWALECLPISTATRKIRIAGEKRGSQGLWSKVPYHHRLCHLAFSNTLISILLYLEISFSHLVCLIHCVSLSLIHLLMSF